jgi:DNA-directed RNA polymerase specialized sigma subunit
MLYYDKGLKMSEIADIMGVSKPAIYRILKRAIKKIEQDKKYFLKS